MTTTRRDRLRELLDAVLADGNDDLTTMAADAYASPFHLSRSLARDAGEPPVALRRRVLLERASWSLGRGARVAETAEAAGYDSVAGFSRAFRRAFGRPPASTTAGSGHRLPAPNGIHFHPPVNLWVDAEREAGTDPAHEPSGASAALVIAQLVHHDLDDVAALLRWSAALPAVELDRERRPGNVVLPWDGPEASLRAVLVALVRAKEVWAASILGEDHPPPGVDDLESLAARHDAVASRWVALWRDIDRRGGWGDRLVDALCDPPESFVLSGVLVHVATYAAHRRQLARELLREARVAVDDGDPLAWLVDGAPPDRP
ncbi:MAG: helix-turn-helix domain-containing protein [Solirubrobacteraceae bacterium]